MFLTSEILPTGTYVYTRFYFKNVKNNINKKM